MAEGELRVRKKLKSKFIIMSRKIRSIKYKKCVWKFILI